MKENLGSLTSLFEASNAIEIPYFCDLSRKTQDYNIIPKGLSRIYLYIYIYT